MSAPPRLGELSAVKLALMAKKVRGEAEAVLRADPIAVVGMACRAPGGADDPARFWEMLCAGKSGVREVPKDRWDADAWFDPDLAAPAKTNTKWAGFIDDIDRFDAGYFGILSREAEQMDPQHRLFLEVATEALDDAGAVRERLAGSRTGVFIASYHSDYAHLQYADLEAVDSRTLTGAAHSVLANRLSYLLDLRGPSVSVDTACSASLVALHLACQSLRTGESDLAVAGGVSLIITPGLMVSISKVGVLAPDGRSKAFDAQANGFGRGEGCGVVVLKRLSDAISDDDRVLAVVRGSSVNQDGHSTLLAAPNGMAQRALIRDALENAQLAPGRIGFVEAHGTGTALGDPIEVEAIAETVGMVPGAGPCFLGAAKANIGHLEAAAGVMGFIKVVLALRHGAVPPQAAFTALNPHISLAGTRLRIPTALTPWPRGAAPRCASVSSFGIGGTNAHAILEEAPVFAAAPAATQAARLLPLSARNPAALRALGESWLHFLAETPSNLEDVCRTAGERRNHFEHRLAVAGSTKEAVRSALARRLEDGASTAAIAASPRVAFVFSGQGPQWHAMGRELLAEEPVFRDVLTECDRLFKPFSAWSLLEELARTEEASRLDHTEVAQAALFSLQVALAALWKSWGVVPSAVVGHSIGELAALHVAGVLGLAEAVRVVWHRGHIMQQATGLGRMAQVALGAADAEAAIRPFGAALSIAALNGPRSTVLSGDTAALEQALATLSERGVKHRLLPVKYAFHSAQMAPFQATLATALGAVEWSSPAVPVYSTVTGALAAGERFDAAYFGRNVRDTVRLDAAISAIAGDGIDAFLEIGPHPVLAASIAESLEARGAEKPVHASLCRQKPERETLLATVARLYELGFVPDWVGLQPEGAVVSLPAYPWQRKRYWLRTRPEAKKGIPAGGHPFAGHPVSAAGVEARIYEGSTEGGAEWTHDHRIFERVLLPGAAVMETLVAAATQVLGPATTLVGFAMQRPLFVPEGDAPGARLQTVVTPAGRGRAELALYQADETGDELAWQRIATAQAEPASRANAPVAVATPADAVDMDAVYARLADLGGALGPSFRHLSDVRRSDGVAEGWAALPPGLARSARLHLLHPVLLDAALQLCTIAVPRGSALPAEILLPLGADRIRIFGAAPERVFARARVVSHGANSLSADIVIEGRDGAHVVPVAAIDGMRFARADPGALAPRAASENIVYDVAWHAVATPGTASGAPSGTWLVCADAGGYADRLAAGLVAAGKPCFVARAGTAFAHAADGSFTVNPADAEHFRRLLAECGSAGPLAGVVHAFALDAAPLEDHAAPGADDARVVASTLHLVQALVARSLSAPELWLVSRGTERVSSGEPGRALRPSGAALRGLASVIALEHPELAVRRVDLDVEQDEDIGITALLSELTVAPRWAPRTAAFRRGQWWTPRLERRRPSPRDAGAVRAEAIRPGTFDGVELRPVPARALKAGEVRLRVAASGLNFRDVLMTLGMYPGSPVPLGVECAGVVTEVGAGVSELSVGMRVFGYAPQSLGTEAVAPAAFLSPTPDTLRDEIAAGLPVAYLTAFYGLHRLAGLKRGDRVLVHAAAGGVGLAAVYLARRAGAVVIGTAGSERKRALLRAVGVEHVFDSRSLLFAEQVRDVTGGEGVDVVLNSLAGDFIAASLGVVKQSGAFLELGKRDVLSPAQAAETRPDVRYHLYDLGSEAERDPSLLRPMLEELLTALAAGEIKPLPVEVFRLDELAEALRFMAQAKHVGKIVVRPAAPSSAPLVASDATYLVTGGLGGIGIETARWLVREGARHLVLTGRSAPSERAAEAVRELETAGATVKVVAADVAVRARMQAVLEEIRATMPPLRGIVHSAGALDDAPIVNLTWERARGVLSGKVHGAWNLHELTRDLPLDFFVLYSAAGVLLGAAGQAAYAAANAELDALAAARARLGLPALSVAWGAWAGAGMAAELATRGPDVWAARGLGKLQPESAFSALERLLRDGTAYAAVLPIDWARFLAELAPSADRDFFASVGPRDAPTTQEAGRAAAKPVTDEIRALPATQRRAALLSYLTERTLHVIGLDPGTFVDPRVPLKEIGLDSLMSVELRNTLARSLARPLPATLLFDYPTADALGDHLLGLLGLATPSAASPESDAAPVPPPDRTALHAIAELSDAEAEALLLKELEGGGSLGSAGHD